MLVGDWTLEIGRERSDLVPRNRLTQASRSSWMGPRNGGSGTLVANAALGFTNREATAFGERFLKSGWEATLHPNLFTADKHGSYTYALSAYWPTEALVIVSFTLH